MSNLVENIKGFLANFEKGQLLGVDIGLSALKLSLLSSPKKGQFKLIHYKSINFSEAVIIEDEIQKPNEIIEGLVEALEEMGTKTRICNLGLSGPRTATKRMQVPDGVKEDIEDNVTWEAEQYLPFSIDDAELDYSVLHKLDDDDVLDVFVSAAHTDLVKNYMDTVKASKLIVKNVDLNIIALNNIFEVIKIDELDLINEEGAIILDFGAQKTSIIVYKNDGPILTKEIPIGGVLITEEIQRQMGLSYEDAESLKTSPDGNLAEEILEIINIQISSIMEELKKVLNFFISAGSSEQVSYCFITGGSSRLPGLIEALQEIISLEIEYLNPFDVIEVDRKTVNEDDLEDIAYCGLTSLGLGLRAVK